MRIAAFLLVSLLAGLTEAPVSGQLRTASPADGFRRGRVPAELQPHARALGRRALGRDAEQVRLDGLFTDENGNTTSAAVTIELSGKTRLDGMRADGAPILFDGDIARTTLAGLTARDQTLLDAIALDSVEGLLAQAAGGAAVRLLGRGFGPDPKRPEQAGGPAFDIFEVTGPRVTRSDRPVGTRRYYFDSGTGLLGSTRQVVNGQPAETRFSYWGVVDGSAYPGLIERYENGVRVFAFATLSAQAGPAGAIDVFRVP